jgi:molybdenum cofactor biosynthesis protein B
MKNDMPPGGGRLSDEIAFRPLNIAVMTVSDTRDEESDTSGRLLAERVVRDGHHLRGRALVRDVVTEIRAQFAYGSTPRTSTRSC